MLYTPIRTRGQEMRGNGSSRESGCEKFGSGHMEEAIEITGFVENRRLSRLHFQVFLLCSLILFIDGLDYNAMNASAPAILRSFHAPRSALGFVFGWGNFGILLGSLLFGYIGDRLGRKVGAVSGVLAYSLPALWAPLAASLFQLSWLRFFAGLGIGGVVPNTVALLSETAPKRYRASFVMIAFVGYSLGNATIARVAAAIIPQFGWPAVFLVAGTAGTLLSLLLLMFLPESVRYLALTRPSSPQLRTIVQGLAPDLKIEPQARFFLRQQANGSSFRLLFTGGQKLATPLLWLGFFAESLTYMTLGSWLAVLLEAAGLSSAQAALVFSYAFLGTAVAVCLFSIVVDRLGPSATTLASIVAAAALFYLGKPGLSPNLVGAIAVLATACGAAIHNSFNGTVGLFYPTGIRGKGVGFATGMGRLAAIIGPVVTGYLLSSRLPLRQVLSLLAVPYLIVAFIGVMLGRLYRSRFGFSAAPDKATEELSSMPLSAVESTKGTL